MSSKEIKVTGYVPERTPEEEQEAINKLAKELLNYSMSMNETKAQPA